MHCCSRLRTGTRAWTLRPTAARSKSKPCGLQAATPSLSHCAQLAFDSDAVIWLGRIRDGILERAVSLGQLLCDHIAFGGGGALPCNGLSDFELVWHRTPHRDTPHENIAGLSGKNLFDIAHAQWPDHSRRFAVSAPGAAQRFGAFCWAPIYRQT